MIKTLGRGDKFDTSVGQQSDSSIPQSTNACLRDLMRESYSGPISPFYSEIVIKVPALFCRSPNGISGIIRPKDTAFIVPFPYIFSNCAIYISEWRAFIQLEAFPVPDIHVQTYRMNFGLTPRILINASSRRSISTSICS